MQAAERDYDLNRAAELKYGTLLQLQRQLKEAEEKLAEKVRSVCSCLLYERRPHRICRSCAIMCCASRVIATGLWMIVCMG